MNLSPRVKFGFLMGLIGLFLAGGAGELLGQDKEQTPPFRLSSEQTDELKIRERSLASALETLRRDLPPEEASPERLADVEIFAKAAEWALRHQEIRSKAELDSFHRVITLGADRAAQLAKRRQGWLRGGVGVARGFVSRVDGSTQPVAVYVPESLEEGRRYRLDVILHGRDDSLTESKFLAKHEGAPIPADQQDRLVVHIYGRGNNAYRWAGETDVFEAIEAVARWYPVDPARIVIRGFSMGGVGAWHLALHHPSTWAVAEAGAGFTETKRYAKLGDVDPLRARLLRIYDSFEWSRNAFLVPIAAYGGENDPQLQASTHVLDSLTKSGVELAVDGLVSRPKGSEPDLIRVVGAGQGHRVDDASRQILDGFVDERAARGLRLDRDRINFTTFTPRYHRGGWIQVVSQIEPLEASTIEAVRQPGKVVIRTTNVAELGIERQVAPLAEIDGQTFDLEPAAQGRLPLVYYRKSADGWSLLDYEESRGVIEHDPPAKRPGLQGPIDDAFMGPFLVIRPTRSPWNSKVDEWARKELARFEREWDRWMRGKLPVKDDVDVTEDDIERKHLVVFGDPGSNRILARALSKLPLRWDRNEVELNGRYPAGDHTPVLIAPNPLNTRRYLVVNSGHTFGEREFRGTNALLFPHLGDFAVMKITGEEAEVVSGGLFDRRWKLPLKPAE